MGSLLITLLSCVGIRRRTFLKRFSQFSKLHLNDKNKMKATLLLCVILGVIAATAAPTEDAGAKIKEGFNSVGEGIKDGFGDAQNAIDDQLGGTCFTSDDCSFYQSCEMASCKITNTAWIVIAVVAGLLVLGSLACICCCVKKVFCCGN